MENDLPDYLDAKGKAVFRTLANRLPALSPDHVYGLQLISYLSQRAHLAPTSEESDRALGRLAGEYNLSRVNNG